ncbi:6-carboxytetrahydropterin synthase [Pedobacter petrophilus]|uniref:6-carboxy-5,6,7,8-tetrahydropterin synthase n=1 Tax=Pedobacter petrophilus TaxID=1908241 RepID=A0A7K0FYA3_9SPHI|nr:6-carboxytetrahydropterin synthase [Pedobacter petrophilus]MRX75696.1 6-carboxytetrahydropterin synthase [Pedobacter petrophilus]
MQIYITRSVRFNAAKRIYREDWTPDQNLKVFGQAANANYHGHNFNLWVTFSKKPTPANEDLPFPKALDNVLENEIIAKIDHKNLSLNVDFIKGKLATTDQLCIAIFNLLRPIVNAHENFGLYSVKLQEAEGYLVTYLGV